MDDAELIRLIADCRTHEVVALAEAAARRRLAAAVPALEQQCRGHIGWGARSIVPAQAAALRALGTIGGVAARAAVERLVAQQVVQGPGLAIALSAAATLRATVPEPLLMRCLHHDEPDIRAAACDCRPMPRDAIPRLVALLSDLHVSVRLEAACALGRLGRAEALPHLMIALNTAPTPAIIASLGPIADDTVIIRLGQIARERKALLPAIQDVLESLDHPRALQIMATLDSPS